MQKMLNYTLKVVKGDVSAIPGIKDAIDVRNQNTFMNHFDV